MRRIGWVIAVAAAWLTPAAAQAPPGSVAAPQASAPSSAPQTTPTAAPAPESQPATNTTPVPGSVGHALPTPGYGMPDGRKGIQEQVTPIGREAAGFHDTILLTVCGVISVFVLGLLLIAMVRFRRGANPVPSRNHHNTTLEVIWTLVPVLILVGIAIPSIRLLRHQYTPPPADVTIKVTGHQWYWSFEYPDNGVSFDSHMLKEAADPTRGKDERARTNADGPPLLAADERMVIPTGKVVKFIVTSDDVIHSFAMPAFWTKIDANPGQLNETWVMVDRPGVYFGQCSELCGARHGFMPLNIEAVAPAQYAQWVASKGGHMPGARPAPGPNTTGSSPVSQAAVPAVAAPQGATGTPPKNAVPPAPAPKNQDVANRATT
jgi:cytochrome c oxidase subunit 2